MACSVKNVFSVSGSYEPIHKCSSNGSFSLGPSILSLQSTNSKDFFGKSLEVSDQKGLSHWSVKSPSKLSINAQSSICISKAMRWWEKTLKPNMVEINSAQELADSLVNAGDRLVIIDFYSPGCGGCKALHPKICQLAESNPDAIFLKVNYEELKAMCYSLHIHVLPFFRFYRGSEGKLCSFSCTNATMVEYGGEDDEWQRGLQMATRKIRQWWFPDGGEDNDGDRFMVFGDELNDGGGFMVFGDELVLSALSSLVGIENSLMLSALEKLEDPWCL